MGILVQEKLDDAEVLDLDQKHLDLAQYQLRRLLVYCVLPEPYDSYRVAVTLSCRVIHLKLDQFYLEQGRQQRQLAPNFHHFDQVVALYGLHQQV